MVRPGLRCIIDPYGHVVSQDYRGRATNRSRRSAEELAAPLVVCIDSVVLGLWD